MRTKTSIVGFFCIALAITAGQILFSMTAEGWSSRAPYASLFQFDSEWYADIANNGYRSSLPRPPEPLPTDRDVIKRETNIAFFPAFPLLGRWMHVVTGLSTEISLLLVSQLAAVGFWTCWLLLLQRLGIPRALRIMMTTMAIVHPAAFYLVTAYSESLFLFGLFGLLCSTLSANRFWWIYGGLFGFLMSTTRFTGLLLAPMPILLRLAWNPHPGDRWHVPKVLMTSILTAGGAIVFFTFCALTFGRWNMYMIRQQAGWGLQTDFLFFLRGFLPLLPADGEQLAFWSSDGLSITVTALTTWMLIGALMIPLATLWRRKSVDVLPLSFLLMAGALFYVNGAVLWSINMQSMIRHTYITHLFLLLWGALLVRNFPLPKAIFRQSAYGAFVALAIASASLQFMLVERFTDAQWVA